MSKLKMIDPKEAASKTRGNNTLFLLLNVLSQLTKLYEKLLQNIYNEWRLLFNFNIPMDILNHVRT